MTVHDWYLKLIWSSILQLNHQLYRPIQSIYLCSYTNVYNGINIPYKHSLMCKNCTHVCSTLFVTVALEEEAFTQTESVARDLVPSAVLSVSEG